MSEHMIEAFWGLASFLLPFGFAAFLYGMHEVLWEGDK